MSHYLKTVIIIANEAQVVDSTLQIKKELEKQTI